MRRRYMHDGNLDEEGKIIDGQQDELNEGSLIDPDDDLTDDDIDDGTDMDLGGAEGPRTGKFDDEEPDLLEDVDSEGKPYPHP
jgi:hypothetical protein